MCRKANCYKSTSIGALVVASALATMTFTRVAAAADITYFVDQSIGTTGSITGTITTDGTIGTLSTNSFLQTSNYVDYNLTATVGGNTAVLSQATAGTPGGFGSAVTATPTELMFNFSATGNPFLSFSGTALTGPPASGGFRPSCAPIWSLRNGGINCNGSGASNSLQVVNDVNQIATTTLTGNQVFATVASSPSEIPLPATLPLFASGLGALGLFGRRRKRCAQAVT